MGDESLERLGRLETTLGVKPQNKDRVLNPTIVDDSLWVLDADQRDYDFVLAIAGDGNSVHGPLPEDTEVRDDLDERVKRDAFDQFMEDGQDDVFDFLEDPSEASRAVSPGMGQHHAKISEIGATKSGYIEWSDASHHGSSYAESDSLLMIKDSLGGRAVSFEVFKQLPERLGAGRIGPVTESEYEGWDVPDEVGKKQSALLENFVGNRESRDGDFLKRLDYVVNLDADWEDLDLDEDIYFEGDRIRQGYDVKVAGEIRTDDEWYIKAVETGGRIPGFQEFKSKYEVSEDDMDPMARLGKGSINVIRVMNPADPKGNPYHPGSAD
jgi:hypothetical protein